MFISSWNVNSVRARIENIKEYLKKFSPEIVFHLAAQPLVKLSYNNPRKTYSTNIFGTINLLESLKDMFF